MDSVQRVGRVLERAYGASALTIACQVGLCDAFVSPTIVTLANDSPHHRTALRLGRASRMCTSISCRVATRATNSQATRTTTFTLLSKSTRKKASGALRLPMRAALNNSVSMRTRIASRARHRRWRQRPHGFGRSSKSRTRHVDEHTCIHGADGGNHPGCCGDRTRPIPGFRRRPHLRRRPRVRRRRQWTTTPATRSWPSAMAQSLVPRRTDFRPTSTAPRRQAAATSQKVRRRVLNDPESV
jgi:hypothetical protein